MSNTPQQVINTGELINDGTGESLRSSFTAINNNFANIWAAGPVDTQVVITNNKVSTGEINLDLILAGNGVGNVRMASTVLPTVAGVYDIGSTTEPFSEIHGQYFYGNGRFLTGISGGGSGGGNVTFSTAVPTNPNVGDIWIQSTTGVQYLYFNDNTSNVWAEMEAYQTFTSIEGGNGNVDFTSVSSDIIPAASNTYSLGNASNQWASLYVSNSTIYIGNVPLAINSSNALTVNGTPVVTVTSNTVANIGNFVFNGNSLQNINGGSFNNGDLSHGSTSGFSVAPNGSGTASVYNTYGNIALQTGTTGTVTRTWTFGTDGNITLPSNASSINYANGSPYGGGSSANIIGNLDITGTYVSIATGADETLITISPNIEGQAYLQIPDDATANVANVRLHNDAGNIELSTGAGSHNWYFGNTGSLTFPNGANIRTVDELTIINSTTTANGVIGINAREQSTGDSVAQVYLDGTDRVARVSTYNPDTEIGYDWTFDAGGSFTLPTSPGNVYFGTNTNGPVMLADSLGITLNANRADTTQDYVIVSQDGVNIFSVNTINIENNTTGFNNSDININSGDDIFLRGRNKVDDTEAEGGDINIFAGQGANSTVTGNDTGSGGDISIQGGAGGLAQGASTSSGSGGFITIQAGDGGTSLDSSVGAGGSLSLSAGSAQTASDPTLGGIGGSVSISAGTTTRVDENGGSIELTTGGSTGLGTGSAGYVGINIPSSNIGPGGNWYFTGSGTALEVPANSSIYGPNFGNFTVGCAGNTIVTSSDYGANVKNWVFGYTGTLTLPNGEPNINTPDQTGIVTFNVAGTGNVTESTQIQFGSDGGTDQFIYMSTQNGTGNAATIAMGAYSGNAPYTTIRTYDGISVTNDWTFTHAAIDPNEAYLYVPGGAAITTLNATGGGAGKAIFIEAGAADQSTYSTSAGGDLYLKGGRGAFNDGGGGGPGGDVNINAGESADPAGVAGNVYITAGALQNWVFDNTGNLTAPNNISTDGNITANIIGASTQLQGKYIVLDTISFTNLPAPTFGARAFINDANIVAAGNFGAQVSGGGSNTTPIWSDGTNWYIG